MGNGNMVGVEGTAASSCLPGLPLSELEISAECLWRRIESLHVDCTNHALKLQANQLQVRYLLLKAGSSRVSKEHKLVFQQLRRLSMAIHVVTHAKHDIREALTIVFSLANTWANNACGVSSKGTKKIWEICWVLVRPPDGEDDFNAIEVMKSIKNCADEYAAKRLLVEAVHLRLASIKVGTCEKLSGNDFERFYNISAEEYLKGENKGRGKGLPNDSFDVKFSEERVDEDPLGGDDDDGDRTCKYEDSREKWLAWQKLKLKLKQNQKLRPMPKTS